MTLLKTVAVVFITFHVVSAWNYGGGGGYDHIPSKIIVKHVPKHVPVYKPVPIPKLVPVPKPVGFLKPLAIAKPFSVPQVVPVIKHFQKPFPVLKGVPFHFPIPLPKLVKLPFQIKIPKPYVVRVPKPYAVPKKYPVAVPVHIPKPYVVPILKPVPVGVPQKIPKIVPVIKEVPEYVKRPVPVYIEEQPYKPEGNYKGTPYPVDHGNYKGSSFPEKGTPFPSGGNKGTPYIPYGKGGGGGGGYHGKGSNVHATSAASFLAAHAGKLQSQSGGYGDILASYSQNHAYPGLQGLGGGIHGGYHGFEGFSGFQGFGGNSHEFQGSYASGAQGYGNYVSGDISNNGYDNLNIYGRGAHGDDTKESGTEGEYQEGYGQSNAGHNDGAAGGISYDNAHSSQGEGGQDAGNNNQAYVGVSVSTFNDHSGRGGGYTDDASAGGYGHQGDYQSSAGENKEHNSADNYQGYGGENLNAGADYNSNGYGHTPTLALYQIQNGAVSPINYPQSNANYYNTGHQAQGNYHGYGNEEQGHGNTQTEYSGYESQVYQQNENANIQSNGPQQQSSYGYQGHLNYPAASQQNEQGYQSPQNEADTNEYADKEHSNQEQDGYNNENSAYENQGSYNNHGSSKVYHNQASYFINHAPSTIQADSNSGYGHQNVAANLQNYGLKAAYAVQSGDNQLQGASGTVYMRAYDQQGGNQVAYNVQNRDNFQTQDSENKESYSDFSETKSDTDSEPKEQDVPAATGRSYDSKDQLVGSSNGYSTQEGGDTKGGSWRAVQN